MRRDDGESDPLLTVFGEWCAVPFLGVKPFGAAVEVAGDVVGEVIGCEDVIFPIKREFTIFDSVAKSTHGCSEVRSIVSPAIKIGMTEGELDGLAVGIGNGNADEVGAELAHLHNHAISVKQGEKLDVLALDRSVESGGWKGAGSRLGWIGHG